MKYAFLSSLIPVELEEFYRKNTKYTMQDAANTLQWNLYEGFCANLNENIPLFNVLPVDSFPQFYKYPFVRSMKFEPNGLNIGFCNVKFIRNYAKTIQVYRELKKWCRSNQERKVLFVYTMSQPLIKAISNIKKRFPDILVCTIVADLPNMSSLSKKRSVIRNMFVQGQSASAYRLTSKIDCFVLLTKHMAEYMNLNQPFCVMEGIADEAQVNKNTVESDQIIKMILYTGTLHKKFGILHLLEAFEKLQNDSYRLVLCGIGDGESEIKKAMERDHRIQFLGQLERDEVLKLQTSATVLVNPRLGHESFTKYSFPSKTMEYLVSGVPVVAYKLEGIPEEYDYYIQYPKNDSAIELANKLEEVCNMEKNKREQIGKSARQFVLQEKNKYTQTKRIIELIRNVEKLR